MRFSNNLNRVSSERHLSSLRDGRVALEVDDSQPFRPTIKKRRTSFDAPLSIFRYQESLRMWGFTI